MIEMFYVEISDPNEVCKANELNKTHVNPCRFSPARPSMIPLRDNFVARPNDLDEYSLQLTFQLAALVLDRAKLICILKRILIETFHIREFTKKFAFE